MREIHIMYFPKWWVNGSWVHNVVKNKNFIFGFYWLYNNKFFEKNYCGTCFAPMTLPKTPCVHLCFEQNTKEKLKCFCKKKKKESRKRAIYKVPYRVKWKVTAHSICHLSNITVELHKFLFTFDNAFIVIYVSWPSSNIHWKSYPYCRKGLYQYFKTWPLRMS